MPPLMKSSLFQNCAPEYVAVVLASSTGSRLFPVTCGDLPKHMMPICGIPVVTRLLSALEASGFQECVVVLAAGDQVTIPHLKQVLLAEDNDNAEHNANVNASSSKSNKQDKVDPLTGSYRITSSKPYLVLESEMAMKITFLSTADDCQGSIDALRKVEEAGVVNSSSNMMVVPGDLMVFDTSVLSNVCDTHREGCAGGSTKEGVSTACTVLLTDVGEQDEHGVPLKESAKQKKGGIGRDEEDIEYIALSYQSALSSSTAPRVVWKQLKIDVQDITEGLAETPKLALPKPRIRAGAVTRVRTDWSDVHVYIFSPWVRRLLVERKSLITVQGDLLPLLVSRQFDGVAATFGSKVEEKLVQEIMCSSPDLTARDLAARDTEHNFRGSLTIRPSTLNTFVKEYAVLAHLQDEAIRTHTIASYMFASREIVTRVTAAEGSANNMNSCLQVPQKSFIRSNFQTILLPGANLGDKVTLRSTMVGRNCKIGNKCRLNNVIIMDNATLGDNVVLQNSIIGPSCTIGNNCSLNDCQMASGFEMSSGEKAKGETFS